MNQNPKRRTLTFFFLLLCIGVGGGLYMLLRDLSGPVVSFPPEVEAVGKTTPILVEITDQASGLASIVVSVSQNGKAHQIMKKEYAGKPKKITETIILGDSPLKNGPIELEINVRDASYAFFGRGNGTSLLKSLAFDTIPPKIFFQNNILNIKQGGSGCVSFRSNKVLASCGVRVKDIFFPGFVLDNGEYVCFFAFPWFMSMAEFGPKLVAIDKAGNEQSIRLNTHAQARVFKTDTLNLPDTFIETKMAEFEDFYPNIPPLERYVKINREMRKSNDEKILALGKKTAPFMLWKGDFLRLPRAASRANFGDHRTYMYGGKEIDQQTHLGVDLASLQNAPVPAANDGKVVFADFLGIYGKLVVIDHGAGLQSLYSHLSDISCTVDEQVKRGQIIGRTGVTGLAGGDHLHFGVTVSGIPVSPIEWWDEHWIKDNILDRIAENANADGSPPTPKIVAPKPAAPPAAKPADKKKTPPKKKP